MVVPQGGDLFQIVLEKKKLLMKPVKFSQAIQAWFDSFWALSLQYPAGLAKTSQFIERFVVGQVTGSATSKLVSTYASKLGMK